MSELSHELMEALCIFPRQMIHLEKYDLPTSEVCVLLVLKDAPLYPTAIAKRLNIAAPNITPLVKDLLAKGYAERAEADGDKRKVLVALTDAGRAKIAELEEFIDAQVSAWDLGKRDEKALLDAFSTIASYNGKLVPPTVKPPRKPRTSKKAKKTEA